MEVCKQHKALLIVDEAHAVGVFGGGKVQELQLENNCFARIITFGKAIGCHGAAILGNQQLKDYLVNFSRSLIYTTGLSPHALATIYTAYETVQTKKGMENVTKLHHNIQHFKSEIQRLELQDRFISSSSAIQSCIVSGNQTVKHIAQQLKKQGFDVKPILSPTVPEQHERLRFCLHSYNSTKEITAVLNVLSTFV